MLGFWRDWIEKEGEGLGFWGGKGRRRELCVFDFQLLQEMCMRRKREDEKIK